MTTPSVPAGPDELTVSWMAAALDDPTVVEAAVEPLGAELGFLGDLYRVRLTRTGAPTDPNTVVVKLPPVDPGGRQVGAMLGVGPREVAFYREVVAASPGIRVPTCHHAAAESGSERWVLVLEDLAPPGEAGEEAVGQAPPAERVDPAERGADRSRATAAVDALVDFQARWWDADQRFDWMPGFDGRGVGGLRDAWLQAIPVFLERYGHLVPKPTDDWLQRFAPTLPDWSDRVGEGTLTIVHADYRLDNLLFTPDGVTMIDWQTALRGPGAMDLASFVATGLTIDDRRRLEPELIDRYRTGLAERGVEFDPDELDRSYDENLLWWMGQFANNLAWLEPDDPMAQRALDTTIERTFTAGLDRNVGRLLT